MSRVLKIVDRIAWMLGSFALGMGVVFFVTIVGGLSAYLVDGNSLSRLMWNFSDPKIPRGMAELLPALILLLGLSAIGLATGARGRPSRVSMAAWAVRSGQLALAFAALLTSLMATLFAFRLVLFS
jgi:hypothetical protein